MDPGTKIWKGIKKLSICEVFPLNYDTNNSRVMRGMSDSFPPFWRFSMIYDMRTYDLNPGALQAYMDAVREVALPLREYYGIKLAGWYYTDIGKLNRVVHIWAYRDYTHFDQARQAVRSDPRWVDEYLPRVKGLVVRQQDQIMLASDFFESRVPALSEDA